MLKMTTDFTDFTDCRQSAALAAIINNNLYNLSNLWFLIVYSYVKY